MDIETIKAILTVSQCDNFSKAASQLCFAPSAISKRISHTEQELGIELFVRGSKSNRLAPTPICQSLIPLFEEILNSWEEVSRVISLSHSDIQKPAIRIGISDKHWTSRIDEIIAQFINEWPNMDVSIVSGSWTYLHEELLQGRLDVLFVTMSGDFLSCAAAQEKEVRNKLEFMLVNKIPDMYMGISSDSPLSSRQEATLPEFKDYSIALNNDINVENSVVKEQFAPFLHLADKYGLQLKTVVMNTRQASSFLVARKKKVAIPRPTPIVDVEGIASVRLSDWDYYVSEYCVAPRGARTAPVVKLISLAKSMSSI